MASPESVAADFLQRLNTPCRLLVAYSGGGDSTGLLVALHAALKASPGLPVSLVAATVDHGLRPGSAEEANAAGALCARLSIPYTVLTWGGEKPRTGMQAAAREARYRLLGAFARQVGADLIVTAHNRDDQAETIAMRQSRDPAATAGMAEAVLYDGRIWVCRPFLGLGRQEIRAYLRERGIGWAEDPSNDNDRFERVRVRKALAQRGRTRLTPLCPAGHLPLKGGDWQAAHSRIIRTAEIEAGASRESISPLEGEMPGRAEGGEPEVMPLRPLGDGKDNAEEAVARYLLANVTVHSALVAVVDLADYSPDDSAHLDAIRHLAALLGGRTHLSGRQTTGRIADFVADPHQHRLAAERVVFDRRKHLLYITRERRSLPTITVEPGATMLWDNRFSIKNPGAGPAVIGVRGDGQTGRPLIDAAPQAESLPGSVGQRVAATEPMLLAGSFEMLEVKPIIPQFNRFLPLPMLEIANALAFLAGLDHFPGLPTR